MEYLRGWRALRNDPEWGSKLITMSVILLVPLIGALVLIGWAALMLRRAVSGQDAPLPRMAFDMDYLGKLLQIGFKGYLAQLLWSLPITVLSMVFGCCLYIGMGGMVGAVAAGGAAGGEAGAGLGALGALCLFGGFFIAFFALIMVLAMPIRIAVMRAELTDDLNSAMRFKDVVDTTKMLFKELLIGHFVMMLVQFVAMLFAICTLYLGLLPALVVLRIVHTYFSAELYQVYLQKGGQPLPVGPLDVEGGNLPPTPPGPQQPQHWGGPPAQF
ncbi:MAG TPA: DUF4013 domain-containing protein [Sandaracinaceae bacterium LLY-WYZ-13_1]|nr:DUF4013 domain-containing protein [Sandaracinaceae bacterium LLY-WYZ-13_1]